MMNNNLHIEFEEAVAFVNSYNDPFPADVLLKLYAYYKIATNNHGTPASRTPLINAFKANALIQAQNIQAEEAMQGYVDLVLELRKELEGL